VRQADDLARLVRLRVERGEARPPELPRVEVEAERARLALSHAQARAMVHRDQLSLWIGRPVGEVAIDMAQAPEPPGLAEIRDRAASEAPRVRAARDRVAAATAEVRAERNQRIPAVSLSGYALSEVDRNAVGGGLGVELPVWNWNSGKIDQAEAIRAAEEARLLVATHEARAALVESWAMCTEGRHASRRLREEVVPRAETAAAKMERSYQLGESPLFEALDSRRALLEVRRELLAAELEQQLECSTLTILAGGELR
jgi:outer membrane protein, heavy metal efflux system